MKVLRIAVDARPLAQPMVGITRYTFELISRLINSPHQWFLYLDKEPVHSLPTAANVHIRYGKIKGRALSTLFAQYVFPIWARHDQIDIFWSPRHHLPLLLPKRIKKILTIHDLVWVLHPETMSTLGRWVERIFMPGSLKIADRILTVSEATKTDIGEYSPLCLKKISTIYSGASFQPPEEKSKPANPYFLFVGTLEPRKNLPRLLKAFALFIRQNHDTRLIIVGSHGWGNEPLALLVNQLGLQKRVDLVGRVNDLELTAYYASATAILMPSLYEGFGLPLVEAMIHGTPVISSNHGAMKEITGNAGLLIDPYSEQSIATAMREILEPDTHQRLVSNALSRSSIFTWDNAAKKVLEEIENV